MSINLDFLAKAYFYFDEIVPYPVEEGTVEIKPIDLKSSEIFLASIDILNVDKNSSSDVSIIQMSYLQFICQVLLQDSPMCDINKQKFVNILVLCLGLQNPAITWTDKKKPMIVDETLGIKINAKQFDEICKIIMYQNILHYDDEYTNPELKKAMAEVDALKNQDKITPSLERKMAIITAHTGVTKKEQQEMTYRSHCLLFEEVCGEVNYLTTRAAVIATSGQDKVDSWIFKKPKDKFEGYIKSVDSYTNSMGGSQVVKSSDSSLGDSYMQQFNSFQSN